MDDSDFDEDLVGAIAEMEDTFTQSQRNKAIPPVNNNITPPSNNMAILKNISSADVASIATVSVPKTVIQRKFPGPAGLLPKRGNSLLAADDILSEKENNDTDFEDKVLSQTTNLIYEMGPWSTLMSDLGTAGKHLLSVMNIESVERGFKRTSRVGKVPFLSVIVDSVDTTLIDPSVSLKDSTGVMPGVLHRSVWEEWASDISPGSVIVLRNVGVINSTGVNSRRQIINITTNNVIAIYSIKSNKSGDVQRRLVRDLPRSQEISCIIDEWKKNCDNISSPAHRNSITNGFPPIKKPRLEQTHKKTQEKHVTESQQPDNKEKRNFEINNSIIKSIFEGIDVDALFTEF